MKYYRNIAIRMLFVALIAFWPGFASAVVHNPSLTGGPVLLVADTPDASPAVTLAIVWPLGLPDDGEVTVTIENGDDKLEILGGSSEKTRSWSSKPYPESFEVKPKAVSSSVNDIKINVQHDSGPVRGLQLTVASIKLKELGFKNDQAIKKHADGQWIDSPDGSVPTWKRENNPSLPVNYIKSTMPTIFGKLEATPTGLNQSFSLRAKESQSERVTITSGLSFSNADITIPDTTFATGPTNSTAVRSTTTALAWEASVDSSTWASIGGSSHLFYWSNAAAGSGVVVYDKALEKACAYVNGATGIPAAINAGIAGDVQYNPAAEISSDLLGAYSSNSSGLQCEDHAKLFQLLLDTIGSPSGTRLFFWGGTQHQVYRYKQSSSSTTNDVSFKSNRPENDGVPAGAHFLYHVLVKIGDVNYDPSYGITSTLSAEYLHPDGALRNGSYVEFDDALANAWNTGEVYQSE